MEAQLQQTREAWLNYVAQRLAAMFEQLGAPLPTQLRISIGFYVQRPAQQEHRRVLG
jgi:hypothetical protein